MLENSVGKMGFTREGAVKIFFKMSHRGSNPVSGRKRGGTRYIHTVECYSALGSRGVRTRATMWVKLEDTVLSEGSPSQEGKFRVIAPLHGPERSQSHREVTESRKVRAGGEGGETRSQCLTGTVSTWRDEKFWR